MAKDTSKQTTSGRPTIEVTPEGLEELKAELSELKDIKLPTVIKRLTEAREYGDLSENAEYHDAKDEQQLIETRIDDIEEVISNAKVVMNTKSTTKIGMGSTVEIKKSGNKSTKTIQIVGEFESNPLEDKISNVSPLGKALVGRKAGDETVVVAPSGNIQYQIVKIK